MILNCFTLFHYNRNCGCTGESGGRRNLNILVDDGILNMSACTYMSALHHYRILHSSTLLYNNSTEDNRIFYLAVNRASVCYDTVIHYTVVTVVCRDFVPDFCIYRSITAEDILSYFLLHQLEVVFEVGQGIMVTQYSSVEAISIDADTAFVETGEKIVLLEAVSAS